MKLSLTYRTSLVRFPYLLALLVSLVLADGLITETLVGNGLGRESNLLLRGLLDNGNFMVFKIVGALACAVILWDVHRRHPRLASVSTLLFIALYTGIVYWNISVFIAGL